MAQLALRLYQAHPPDHMSPLTPRQPVARRAQHMFSSKADMAIQSIGSLPFGWQIYNEDGLPMAEPLHPVIGVDKTWHVDDPVIVITASSKLKMRQS